MQLWLNFVLMVALAVMVGVSISANQTALEQSLRQAYVEDHPDLNEDVTQAILKGELTSGMEPDHVRISWGNPEGVVVLDDQPQVEMWRYSNALVLFELGVVRDWATARSRYDSGEDLVRRFGYVLLHDQLPTRTANLIRKGEITTGMSPEQVQASWGEPQEILPIYSDTLGESTVWVYERGEDRRITITFQEGEVLNWSEARVGSH